VQETLSRGYGFDGLSGLGALERVEDVVMVLVKELADDEVLRSHHSVSIQVKGGVWHCSPLPP